MRPSVIVLLFLLVACGGVGESPPETAPEPEASAIRMRGGFDLQEAAGPLLSIAKAKDADDGVDADKKAALQAILGQQP